MTKVSVIIPTYNAEKWIDKTIESCISQGDYLKEIIIVDDFSTDQTLDICNSLITKYPNFIRLYYNKIKGGNNARNYGFEKSKGEYIQWLDSDDLLIEGKFNSQITFLEANQQIDIVYSDWQINRYVTKEEFNIEKQLKSSYNDMLFQLIIDNWNAPHVYLMRKKVAQFLYDVKAWNPNRKIAQDREYYIRAAIQGFTFAYIPGNVAIYNIWNEQSVSRKMTFKKRLQHSAILENDLYQLITSQSTIKNKDLYFSILNAQLLIALFHFPTGVRVMRSFKYKQVYFPLFPKKLKLISWLLYFYSQIKFLFKI